jgi:hypothetical protein
LHEFRKLTKIDAEGKVRLPTIHHDPKNIRGIESNRGPRESGIPEGSVSFGLIRPPSINGGSPPTAVTMAERSSLTAGLRTRRSPACTLGVAASAFFEMLRIRPFVGIAVLPVRLTV